MDNKKDINSANNSSNQHLILPKNWKELSLEDWIKLFENVKADVYVHFFTNK